MPLQGRSINAPLRGQTDPAMPPARAREIAFEQVVLERGGARLFDALDLTLADQRIGLIGANGSGKSSLLRLVNGLLLPDSGRVLTCDHDTREARAQLPGIAGFLFQNPDHQILFPTIGEEIEFGLRENGHDAKAAAQRTREILQRHGWQGWETRPVHELSEGQKQKLCFMAVLALSPQVLLLDEPFASLDMKARREFLKLMFDSGCQIVMASHDLEMLANFDRIIWLERGRIRSDGAPGDIIAAYRQEAISEEAIGEEALTQ